MLNSILKHLFRAGSGTSTAGIITAVNPENEIICLENYMGKTKLPTISFSREVPSRQIAYQMTSLGYHLTVVVGCA